MGGGVLTYEAKKKPLKKEKFRRRKNSIHIVYFPLKDFLFIF
jgi:hypothetical protein